MRLHDSRLTPSPTLAGHLSQSHFCVVCNLSTLTQNIHSGFYRSSPISTQSPNMSAGRTRNIEPTYICPVGYIHPTSEIHVEGIACLP
ncbi:hypothetical protein M3J09_000973 [Ascochyta lentis]